MIALGVMLVVIVGVTLFSGMFKAPQPRISTPELLSQLVAEANKGLPMMVDTNQRMDKVELGAGNVLIYDFTLPHLSKSQLGNLSAVQKSVRQAWLDNYKAGTTPQMKSLRVREVELDYKYRDQNGVFVFEVSVNPKDF